MLPGPLPDLDVTLFAPDYAGARMRFLRAAGRASGVRLEDFAHPLPGPGGELLALDTAWVGPRAAQRVLVTQSALHGVEGFAGSAVQCDALGFLAADRLPPDTAILHLHALNPWGFAWCRRTNEDGVDLNRNFIDFARPLPANAGYDALAKYLLPAAMDRATLEAADRQLAAFARELGRPAYERAVSGGQYRHAQGLFYGGTGPTWTSRRLQDVLTRYALRERELVAVVDLHTGLGPYGYGEPICDHLPDSRGLALARRFYGDSVTEPARGTSTSVPKHGLVDYFWHRELGDRVCFITLEFGTYDIDSMFRVLREDHWLHAQHAVRWADRPAQQVKGDMRAHFAPGSTDWRQMVLFRGRQVLLQGLAGIGAK